MPSRDDDGEERKSDNPVMLDLVQRVARLEERVSGVERLMESLQGRLQSLENRLERLDNRVWLVLSGIIASILVTILTRLL